MTNEEKIQELRSCVHDKVLWLTTWLDGVVSVPMLGAKGNVVNRYAAACIPDWLIRQNIDEMQAVLKETETATKTVVNEKVPEHLAPTVTSTQPIVSTQSSPPLPYLTCQLCGHAAHTGRCSHHIQIVVANDRTVSRRCACKIVSNTA